MAKTSKIKGLKNATLHRGLAASCRSFRGVRRGRSGRVKVVKVGRRLRSMRQTILHHAITTEVGENRLSVKKPVGNVSNSDHKEAESRNRKQRKRKNTGEHGEVDSQHEVSGMEDNQHAISGMGEWENIQTPIPVIQALKDMGFVTPTEIQRQTIPPAIAERCDVIGAAETGSGKTLAFAIPILHYILHHCKHEVRPGGQSCHEVRPGGQSRHEVRPGGQSRHEVRPGGQSRHEVRPGGQSRHEVRTAGQKRRKIRGKSQKGSRIIDLNQVIHLNEDNGTNIDDEASEDNSDDGVQRDTEEGDCDSSHEQSSGEDHRRRKKDDSLQSSKVASLGLVAYRDNIPQEEFEAMLLGSDIITESHDPSSDIITESHDPSSDIITESHDPSSDIITESHGPSSDIITESHDPSGDDEVTTSYNGKLIALILAPTRELALQACALVGGMAMEKQERLLGQKPPIVVATPGRLWKLMSEGDTHLCSLDDLRFLVLDEADRMVEFGHFQELGMILDRVNGSKSVAQRQTLVFSATLTLPRRSTERKKRKKKSMTRQESIDNLMSRVGLRENSRVIDLTTTQGTVHTLTETKIMCTGPEKDLYLYYFLLVYPGRTLVFINSIDCLQRVRSLLELLQLKPLPLHAHMQQRQRIKNLERFVSNPQGLLLASDVAARGLDIPEVQHVIHYQVPRNSELYVHRSGRTARAHAEGLSVILVGPEDLKAYHNICRTLNRDDDLPTFPAELTYFRAIRERVGVAREIDSIQHKQRKTKKSNDWFIQSAKAMDVELDEDLLEEEPGNNKKVLTKVQTLKAKLNQLLSTTLIPRTVSSTFPTRGENHKIITSIQKSSQQGQHKKIIVAEETDALTVAKHKQMT